MEDIFRANDVDYLNVVEISKFEKCFNTIKIDMTQTQIKRFFIFKFRCLFIFDE